jgi:hypothetical protein
VEDEKYSGGRRVWRKMKSVVENEECSGGR